MTVKLLALYRRPDDEAAFLAHYFDVHMPLVDLVPGLDRTVVNRVDRTLMGEGFFMVAELHFADQAAFDAAMASPQNRAVGKDLMSFAADIATLLVVHEESA